MKRSWVFGALLPLTAPILGAVAGACFTTLCGLFLRLLGGIRGTITDHVLLGLFAGGVAGTILGVLRAVDRWLSSSALSDEIPQPPK
jgi:hypothetical protein